jgi:hypothetical protein
MEKYKVFYSWQSDLPNATNRSFIEKPLEDAAKAIRVDESIKIEPVIDRDTTGVPGSPDIANTILAKIEQSQVFVCDVSIINQGEKSRKTPNPNVLIELGYAIKTLGSDRILMIMNTAFGPPEQLPFDLSKKRVATYRMPEECKDRATERKALTSKLEEALRTIFNQIETQPSEESPVSRLKKYLVDERYRIQLDELMSGETDQLRSYLDGINTPPPVVSDESPYVSLVKDFEERATTMRDLMITGCYYGERKHDQIWQRSLEQILNPVGANIFPVKRYPALVLLYAGALPAVFAKKYDTLKSLLIETKYLSGQQKFPLVLCLSPWDIMKDSNIRSGLLKQQNESTPVSSHLLDLLKESLINIIPDHAYGEYFDRFEYFYALVRMDIAETTRRGCNVAIGRFASQGLVSKRNNGRTVKSGILEDIELEAKKAQDNWEPLRAGFFDGNIKRFLQVKEEFDDRLERLYYELRFP